MGFFSKSNDSACEQNSEITVIAKSAILDGVFNFLSSLHVYGKVNGKIISSNAIIVGKKGIVVGEVEASNIIINGKFEGIANCNVINILEGGEFYGIAICDELILEPKSYFEGECRKKVLKESIKISNEEVIAIASSAV